MNEQTDAAEAEALARIVRRVHLSWYPRQGAFEDRMVDAILASDWLAAREAAAEARGAERALREAADALEGGLGVFGIPQTLYDTRVWLRVRAAQVAPSRVPGEGS